jgi:hypothetical protein
VPWDSDVDQGAKERQRQGTVHGSASQAAQQDTEDGRHDEEGEEKRGMKERKGTGIRLPS